jgi:membrane fusion protein, epimerase transport system
MSDIAIHDRSHAEPLQPPTPPSDSARGAVWTGLAIMALFFGGIGGWAAYAPLNGAVVAPAVVKVDGNRKTIQHLDGGIVRELRVREGDRVEAGQTVIVLDDTQARAGVTMLSQQHDAYRAQQARLVAERDKLSAVPFPPDLAARRGEPEVAAILLTEEKQFEIRRTGLTGQVSVLKQRIQQLEEQIRAAQAQEVSQKEQLALIREQLKDQRYLLDRGLTQRPRVLELERTAAAITGQAGEIAGNIAKARQAIGEVELQMVQAQNDRMTDIAKDLRDTQDKLLDLPPKLQAAGDVLNRTELRTPYSGYVVGLSVFSVGGVIGKGEKVMDIVPTRNELTVEANVNVDDAHEVRPGMRAEVQFLAYKQRVVPQIHGEVTQVSADRLTDAKTGVPYYTALVRVEESELAEAKTKNNVDLQPGMSATVMIPTRERTALDYLIGPVVASFDHAFRQK